MLDTWLDVESNGFAQEALVTKWKVRDAHRMLGGAGNVAANLNALGSEAVHSEWSLEDLPQKYRLVEGGAVVCRWDIDQVLPEVDGMRLDVDAIVLSDYDKGRFGPAEPPVDREFEGLPVFCDTRTPKRWMKAVGQNWFFFPNTKEYYADKSVYAAAMDRGAKVVMTRGVQGATVFDSPNHVMFEMASPDPCADPVSVCGAGDVVVAVVAHLVTRGAPLEFAVAEAMRLAARCVRRPYTCLVQEEDLNAD